jgi:hypothetical protein
VCPEVENLTLRRDTIVAVLALLVIVVALPFAIVDRVTIVSVETQPRLLRPQIMGILERRGSIGHSQNPVRT